MAAAYLFHICQAHAFVDRNKRTAAMSALVFLDFNGVTALPEPSELEPVVFRVASGAMPKSELVNWFESRIGEN